MALDDAVRDVAKQLGRIADVLEKALELAAEDMKDNPYG